MKTPIIKEVTLAMALLLAPLLHAGTTQWQNNVEAALSKAKHSEKPVFIVVYRDDCEACAQLFGMIRSNKYLTGAINKYEHAAVKISEFSPGGTLPAPVVTPTVYLLDSSKNLLVAPVEGTPRDIYKFTDYLIQVDAMYSEYKARLNADTRP